jgi:hypothetical protein
VGCNSGKGESLMLWVISGEAAVRPSPEVGSPFSAYTRGQVNLVVIYDTAGFSPMNGSPPKTVLQSHSPYQRAFFSSQIQSSSSPNVGSCASSSSEWATRPMKRLEEFMVVSFDGTKQKAVELFSSIKFSCKENYTYQSPLKKAPGSRIKGVRELFNLPSSVDYDSRRSPSKTRSPWNHGKALNPL